MQEYQLPKHTASFGHDGLDYFYSAFDSEGLAFYRFNGDFITRLRKKYNSKDNPRVYTWQHDNDSSYVDIVSYFEVREPENHYLISHGNICPRINKSKRNRLSPNDFTRNGYCLWKDTVAIHVGCLDNEHIQAMSLISSSILINHLNESEDNTLIVFNRITHKIILEVLVPDGKHVWLAPDCMTVAFFTDRLSDNNIKVLVFDLD